MKWHVYKLIDQSIPNVSPLSIALHLLPKHLPCCIVDFLSLCVSSTRIGVPVGRNYISFIFIPLVPKHKTSYMAFCWVSEWIEDILHPPALSPSSSSHSHLPSRLTLANNHIDKSLTWCCVLLWVFLLLSHSSLTASTYLCPTIVCTLNSFKMSINTIENIKHRIPSIRSQTSSQQVSAWILQLLAMTDFLLKHLHFQIIL